MEEEHIRWTDEEERGEGQKSTASDDDDGKKRT